MSRCRFGTASTDITPGPGVDLFSLDGQVRTSNTVLDELQATAVCLDDCRGGIATIISADIIWLSREICKVVRRILQERIGLSPASVFLCATHTHGSPQLPSNHQTCRDEGYEKALINGMVDCAVRAYEAMEPGRLSCCSLSCPVAVYRRKRLPDPRALKRLRLRTMMANRPVPGHPIDDVLTSIRIDNAAGHPVAMLLNFACHPALFRGDAVSADYPGYVRKLLRDRYGKGFETVFLLGFAGNLRPGVLRRVTPSFPPSLGSLYSLLFDRLLFEKNIGPEDLEAFAGRVARCLDRGKYSPFGPCSIRTARTEAVLPLANEEGEVSLGIHYLQLADDLALIGIEGEVFMEYAQWLRHVAGGAIPVSCCGGMVGYVPDEAGMAAGGYEVERSLREFGLSSRFASGIEERVKDGVIRVMEIAGSEHERGNLQ